MKVIIRKEKKILEILKRKLQLGRKTILVRSCKKASPSLSTHTFILSAENKTVSTIKQYQKPLLSKMFLFAARSMPEILKIYFSVHPVLV